MDGETFIWNGATDHLRHRWRQCDELLNVDRYLQEIFWADQRVREADAELAQYVKNAAANASETAAPVEKFTSHEAAESWCRRVRQWRENLQRDLCATSVLAPGTAGVRWLLQLEHAATASTADATSYYDATGGLRVRLCKDCFAGLSHKNRSGQPKLVMPEVALANGLWGGPEPHALSVLSYAERKVLQLARCYVSVKRVFLDRRSFARTARNETPRYHEKNVVAYPQNLDMVQRIVGLAPARLADALTVQFVGSNRTRLRHGPE